MVVLQIFSIAGIQTKAGLAGRSAFYDLEIQLTRIDDPVLCRKVMSKRLESELINSTARPSQVL